VTGPTVDAHFADGFSPSWILKKKFLSAVINQALGVVKSSFHFYFEG
jgi:hypothetical protein